MKRKGLNKYPVVQNVFSFFTFSLKYPEFQKTQKNQLIINDLQRSQKFIIPELIHLKP